MKTLTKLLLLLCTVALLFAGWFMYERHTEQRQIGLVLGSDINAKNTIFDRVLRVESATLESFVFDFSHNDSLLAFLQNPEGRSFPATRQLLKTMNLYGIWVLRPDLQQAFSLAAESGAGPGRLPLAEEEMKKLLSQRHYQHFFVKAQPGFFEIRCAPLQPQSDWDRSTPPRGFLFAARLWNAPYIDMLSSMTESVITLIDVPLDSAIVQPSYDFENGKIFFTRVLFGWDSRPLAMMSVACDAPALHEFNRLADRRVAEFILFFVMVQILLTGALLRWLGLPMRRISQSLERADPAPLAPLVRARDEIGKFARIIVSSFEQQKLITAEIAERARAEERLREANQMLKARDQELNATNQQLVAANQQLKANLQQIRKSEQQLLEHEAYLKIALDIAEETVWELDLSSGMMRIVKMSDKAGRDPGFAGHDGFISWSRYVSLCDAESQERMQRALDDHLRGRTERFVFETRLQKRTGEWFWLYSLGRIHERDESGDPLKILGTSIDITQIKQAQEELNLLATALEQAWECIVITDRNASILYANPAFERTTGYSIAEVLGRNPRLLQSGKHDPEHYRELWECLQQGRVWRGHFIDRRRDGSLFEQDSTITPLNNGAGEVVNFIGVMRDVTEKMHMERQLRQSQKMEAIGTLAGGIAHDFNNILTAINGYAELSLLPGTTPGRLRSNLEQVLRAGARARDLVSQILSFSRQTEQEMRPVGLTPIIKEAVRFLRASLLASIEIRQHIDADSDVVLADPTQLHQVLMNLCTNAGYAMRDTGGVLDIRLSRITYDGGVAFGHARLKSGTYLRLSVSDTGHGMEQDILEHIFEPYFTTKSRGDGTGLGLAVVHGIVQNHGGVITAYSEPGRGSMFEVMLPALEVLRGADEAKPAHVVGGTEFILLIDDEPALVQMAAFFLEPLGYAVRTASAPEEALSLFAQHEFDLVITDKVMPRMNGFALADRIRLIRPAVPIIMCTGFAEKSDLDRARAAGIYRVLTKPYTMHEIASAVREALDRN